MSFVVPRMNGKWLVSRHAERDTWEFAGGRVEPGERAEEAALRELYEETGAVRCELHPVAAYSVRRGDRAESFGMLYDAEVRELGDLPGYEMAEIQLTSEIPDRLTYPDIYPALLGKVRELIR
jgi:8-oxo-dGTP diphosphatase